MYPNTYDNGKRLVMYSLHEMGNLRTLTFISSDIDKPIKFVATWNITPDNGSILVKSFTQTPTKRIKNESRFYDADAQFDAVFDDLIANYNDFTRWLLS